MSKVEKEVLIKNKQGLHARPAALFVQTAAKFDSSVRIKKDDQLVDGKSIMSILSLGAEYGHRITIIAEGEDAPKVVSELEKILTEDNEEN